MEENNEALEVEISKLRKTIELIVAANNCLGHMVSESNEVQEIFSNLCVSSDSLKQHSLVMSMRDVSEISANINGVRTSLFDTISRLTELYLELTGNEYFSDVKKNADKIIEEITKVVKVVKDKNVMKSEHKVNLINPADNINLANAVEYFSEHFTGKEGESNKTKKTRKKKEDNNE